tara:strand:- start:513 stop:683 length:171 start_codon:yes stop_codon:yes gene_type:complete
MKILERIELRRTVNGEGHILTRGTWSLAYIYSATPCFWEIAKNQRKTKGFEQGVAA